MEEKASGDSVKRTLPTPDGPVKKLKQATLPFKLLSSPKNVPVPHAVDQTLKSKTTGSSLEKIAKLAYKNGKETTCKENQNPTSTRQVSIGVEKEEKNCETVIDLTDEVEIVESNVVSAAGVSVDRPLVVNIDDSTHNEDQEVSALTPEIDLKIGEGSLELNAKDKLVIVASTDVQQNACDSTNLEVTVKDGVGVSGAAEIQEKVNNESINSEVTIVEDELGCTSSAAESLNSSLVISNEVTESVINEDAFEANKTEISQSIQSSSSSENKSSLSSSKNHLQNSASVAARLPKVQLERLPDILSSTESLAPPAKKKKVSVDVASGDQSEEGSRECGKVAAEKKLPKDEAKKLNLQKKAELLAQKVKEREEKKLEEERKRLEKKQEEEKKRLEKKLEEEKKRLEKKQEEEKKRLEKQKEKENRLLEKKQQLEEQRKQKQEEIEKKEKLRLEKKLQKEQLQKEKEAEKERADQAQKQKEEKLKATFANFFVKKDVAAEVEEPVKCLQSFPIKDDMRMAPIHRNLLSNSQKLVNGLDEWMITQSLSQLYLNDLIKKVCTPRKSFSTWDCRDEDVVVIDEWSDKVQQKSLKRKYFRFSENVRPPYSGTWQKRSLLITPRRPMEKDEKYLNYEVDSDDEWEEEPGDSLSQSEGENESDDNYEVDNDLFVPHGYLSDGEGDGDEENKEAISPETLKMKLKMKEVEFEKEMKKKCLPIKPLIVGCIWANSDSFGNVELEAFAAVILTTAPIDTKFTLDSSLIYNASAKSSKKSKCANLRANNSVLSDIEIPWFIKLVHGNTNNQVLIFKEFQEFWSRGVLEVENSNIEASQAYRPSKSALKRTLKSLAKWGKCPQPGPMYNEMAWFVNKELLAKYNLENLSLPNRWKYCAKLESVNSSKDTGY